MIGLSKAFNSGKKGKEKWNGYMMTTLRGILRKDYNIDYKELDIKLGFYYAEPGISRFDDRECLIFFNLPGVPAEINKMTRLFFELSKEIVDKHYSNKEQEQMAGRITNFNSLISKELYFLADAMVISPYFEEQRIMKGIGNTLNYSRLIKHLKEHSSEMTTKDIKDKLYSHRHIDSVRKSLNLIFEEDFILERRENVSNNRNTKYTWFLKNS